MIGQQPAALEEDVKPAEFVDAAQPLKLEMLENLRRSIAVIEPEGDEVADDAPGAVRQAVEVIPALLDGRAAVELVVVQIGRGIFEFDHGTGVGGTVRRKCPQRRVGDADVRDGELVLKLVSIGLFGGGQIMQGIAEDFIEELRIERYFLLGEVAIAFQVGPFDQNFVGLFQGQALKERFFGLVVEIFRQDQVAMPRHAAERKRCPAS